MTESSETTGRRVYVGNLSWNVKWQDLKDHMRSAGDVEHATILESAGRSKVSLYKYIQL
jgi:RNA recognition motif-containing protein